MQKTPNAVNDTLSFLSSTEGAKFTEEFIAKRKLATQAKLDMAAATGTLTPGMEIIVGESSFLVLGAAHEDAGPGWFYVAPVLPTEGRDQVQVAPLQVLFHPPTAAYAEGVMNDPKKAMAAVIDLVSGLMGDTGQ